MSTARLAEENLARMVKELRRELQDLRGTALNRMTPAQGAFVRRTTAVSIAHNAEAVVPFDVEGRDDGEFWNSADPGRFSISESGWYNIGVIARWASNSTGHRLWLFRHGGSGGEAEIWRHQIGPGDAVGVGALGHSSAAGPLYFQAGDFVSLLVYQNSGAALNLNTAHAGIIKYGRTRSVATTAGPGVWQTPTFQNGWTNFSQGWQPVRFRKEGDLVRINGLAHGSSATARTIFTLPTGYRPSNNMGPFAADKDSNAYGPIEVLGDGTVSQRAFHAVGYQNVDCVFPLGG